MQRFHLLLLLALLFAGVSMAQFNSSIEGTVADSTQAGIPGAKVVVINEDTQVTNQATTSETGYFRISQLPPGRYRVEVAREGFKSWVQTDLLLQGSEPRTV